MATSKDELAKLRALALKREQDAARKVARHESKGVKLSGSAFDVRKGADAINRMSGVQLEKHLQRVDKFMSRRQQFVSLGVRAEQSRIIPASKWRAYKRQEARNNARVNAFYDQFKDLKLPDGNTIDKRMWTAQHPYSNKDKAIDPLFNPRTRGYQQIVSPKALDALTKDLKARNSDINFEHRLNRDRQSFMKMVETLGDEALKEKVSKLSDRQFHALWNYSEFTRQLAMNYDIHRLANTTITEGARQGEKRGYRNAEKPVMENNAINAHTLAEHAFKWEV